MRPLMCSNARNCTHMPVVFGILHAELQLCWQPGLGVMLQCSSLWLTALPVLETASTATSCTPAQDMADRCRGHSAAIQMWPFYLQIGPKQTHKSLQISFLLVSTNCAAHFFFSLFFWTKAKDGQWGPVSPCSTLPTLSCLSTVELSSHPIREQPSKEPIMQLTEPLYIQMRDINLHNPVSSNFD